MSDDGISPEASVAGEAAAAAVEELHAREAVADAAMDASLDASMAVAGAQEAAFAADSALVSAESAIDAAETAELKAESALETATTVGYATAAAMEEMEARIAERLRLQQEYIDSKIPVGPPVEETPDFVEVEADGNGVSDNRTGAEGDATTDAGQPEKSPRYGLRHRKSR